MAPVVYFVVPCYRDEETVPVTGPVFLKKLRALIEAGAAGEESRLLLLNDGSPDGTWNAICALQSADPMAVGVDLARNSGEENALLAGMDVAVSSGADCVITMDSDLQDDIDAVDEMLLRYSEGSEIVLGVRSSRANDSFSERFFSSAFYTAMRVLGTGLVPEHANFRLMSRGAVQTLLASLPDRFYLPALVCSLELPRSQVTHVRFPRAAGESGYNFTKKLRLGLGAAAYHARTPLLRQLRSCRRPASVRERYRIREIRR